MVAHKITDALKDACSGRGKPEQYSRIEVKTLEAETVSGRKYIISLVMRVTRKHGVIRPLSVEFVEGEVRREGTTAKLACEPYVRLGEKMELQYQGGGWRHSSAVVNLRLL